MFLSRILIKFFEEKIKINLFIYSLYILSSLYILRREKSK
jgi:hypothetical protein